jgi:alpha-1,6-mannosyltransferase
MSVGFVTGATAGCAALTVLERRRPVLGPGPVVAAIVVVFAVAVAFPPRTSNDLWSYTMYGRTITVHHASPYERVPADYPSDPFLRHVSPIWRHRSSVFGPLWAGYSAVGTSMADESVFASRLFFQITAAAAAAAALALVWRRTRSTTALIWLGLHPVFGAIAVNGGHNDLVIGLAVLVAVLLFTRRRPVLAGVVLGLAALVKLTALLALIGFVVWSVRHARRRSGALVVGGAVGTVALGYLPVVASAWHVLSGADRTVTPASIWNPIVDLLLGHNSFRDVAHPLAPNNTLIAISYASLALVVVLAVVVGWRAARSRRSSAAVGAALAAYPFGAEYAFPWYGCWALPCFAEAGPSPLAWVVWVQAAAMLAALKLPIHWQGTPLDGTVRVLLTFITPVVMLILFVGAGWVRDRSDRRSEGRTVAIA